MRTAPRPSLLCLSVRLSLSHKADCMSTRDWCAVMSRVNWWHGIQKHGLQQAAIASPTGQWTRSVSFSEEAPCVKFIPGSAEQRGTNFKLALSGERPFCRPLKHKEGYFLLTAEVDGETRRSIFLGLQVSTLSCRWSSMLTRG